MATAAILTIGNELVSGDVPNTNGSWLARRLAPLGVGRACSLRFPTRSSRSRSSIRREAPLVDFFLVTGGLGGTPDDLTREALAYAFDVAQEELPELAADLRARFTRDPEYAARWAPLPRGARRSRTRSAARPASRSRTSTSCPACPSEMEAMFDAIAEEFRRGSPIGSWRRTYRTRESVIAPALVEAGERWPGVIVGSYPTFGSRGRGRGRREVERRGRARARRRRGSTSALEERS